MPRRIAGPCPIPGCPNRAGQCGQHTRQANAEHRQRYAAKYDARHVRLRADYQRRMDSGEVFTCWRCEAKGRPHPVDPAPRAWDLGHDDDTGEHRGPECITGNRATSGRTKRTKGGA